MSYGIIFWGKLQAAIKSSKCKRGQLELSQEPRIEILAEIYLKT
jgi:hypothetical protein